MNFQKQDSLAQPKGTYSLRDLSIKFICNVIPNLKSFYSFQYSRNLSYFWSTKWSESWEVNFQIRTRRTLLLIRLHKSSRFSSNKNNRTFSQLLQTTIHMIHHRLCKWMENKFHILINSTFPHFMNSNFFIILKKC